MTRFYKYKVSMKAAFRLALPIIAGQLGLVLMGFFDTVQVGGLGATYMGACGVANSVYFLFMLLGMGVLYSVSPLVSEAFGEHHGWKSIGVLRSGFFVSIAISIIFYFVMMVVGHNFFMLRETETITGLAQRFLRVLNYSTPALIFLRLPSNLWMGRGAPKFRWW